MSALRIEDGSVGRVRDGLRPLLWLAAGLLVLAAQSSAVAQAPDIPLPPVKAGVLLIASPALNDPNFHQTVVLICEHGPEGTIGVIINRPTELLLSEALPGQRVLKGTTYTLFVGGPVQPNGLLLLVRSKTEPARTRKILEGVYLGGDMDVVERLVTKPQPSETFRAFAGYAGWAPGQLDFEMSMGSWAPVVSDAATIFEKDPTHLWSDLVESLRTPRTIRSSLPMDRRFPPVGSLTPPTPQPRIEPGAA